MLSRFKFLLKLSLILILLFTFSLIQSETFAVTAKKIKSGQSCNPIKNSAIKSSKSTFYCVLNGDGKYRFIENFKTEPTIINPKSPSNITDCQPPDLRGGIPNGFDPHSITFPAQQATLKNSGELNLAVIPIDFPDLEGIEDPSKIYLSEMEKLQKWYKFFSNGKLLINIRAENKWHRAPNISSHYDVGEWKNVSLEGFDTRQLTEELLQSVKNSYDFNNLDAVLFIYPRNIENIELPITRSIDRVNVPNNGSQFLMVMATSKQSYTDQFMGPLWLWTAHEMLHHQGLVMHYPVNPFAWGVEWGSITPSQVLLPWNQSIFGWLQEGQLYCIKSENINKEEITLVPVESEKMGTRTVFIRVSESEVLMVVSHRKSTWSSDMKANFYGVMVALIDTSKQTDRTFESKDDQTGTLYSKSGVYLHPFNRTSSLGGFPKFGANPFTAENLDWGARFFLGDYIDYKGVRIKLVKSNNFDTISISKI